MKMLIYMLLIPVISFAQEFKIEILNRDFTDALVFQNSIRNYYGLHPLKHSKKMSVIAKKALASYIKENRDLNTTNALVYVRSKDGFKLRFDYFTDAVIGWTVDRNMSHYNTSLNQVLCEQCDNVGFAIETKNDLVYVITKYDGY